MYDRKEDTDQNFRRLLLLILFLLFLGLTKNQDSNSKKLSSHNEAVSSCISCCSQGVVNLGFTGIHKFYFTSEKPIFGTFLIRDKISCDNNRIASLFYIVQKSTDKIIPVFTSGIYLHHFPEKESDHPLIN